ncbi:MAG: hypothetical protein HOZ81_34760, partial [Streptomyces sp.]|nr:hypothetical protein [Streptomyces sp.]
MTDIHLDPPNGIPPALIGMPFEQAVEAVAVWGEVRVVGPFAPDPTVKIQALDHEDSALRV